MSSAFRFPFISGFLPLSGWNTHWVLADKSYTRLRPFISQASLPVFSSLSGEEVLLLDRWLSWFEACASVELDRARVRYVPGPRCLSVVVEVVLGVRRASPEWDTGLSWLRMLEALEPLFLADVEGSERENRAWCARYHAAERQGLSRLALLSCSDSLVWLPSRSGADWRCCGRCRRWFPREVRADDPFAFGIEETSVFIHPVPFVGAFCSAACCAAQAALVALEDARESSLSFGHLREDQVVDELVRRGWCAERTESSAPNGPFDVRAVAPGGEVVRIEVRTLGGWKGFALEGRAPVSWRPVGVHNVRAKWAARKFDVLAIACPFAGVRFFPDLPAYLEGARFSPRLLGREVSRDASSRASLSR